MPLDRKKWYFFSSDNIRKSHITQAFQRDDTLYSPRISVNQKLIINISNKYRAFSGVRFLQLGTVGQSPTLGAFSLHKISPPEKHEINFMLNSDKDLKINE